MNEFRRELLAEGSGAPEELTAEERFLLDRFAAVAALLLGRRAHYRALWERHRDEGPSAGVAQVALEAAGDIAVVMQSLRRRQGLLLALRESPINPAYATGALDQIFFSLTLLTGASQDVESEAALTPEALDELLELPKLRDWLSKLGADEVFGTD